MRGPPRLLALRRRGRQSHDGTPKQHDKKTETPPVIACLEPQRDGNFKAPSLPATPAQPEQSHDFPPRFSQKIPEEYRTHGIAHHRLPLDPQFGADPGTEGAGAHDARDRDDASHRHAACRTTAGWRHGASSSIAARPRKKSAKSCGTGRKREGPLPEGRRNQELTRFSRAPLVIGVVSSPKENPKIPQWEMFLSGGAAAMNLMLAANALGYGTNRITNWYSDTEEGRALLGLAPHERVVGFVHIGTYEAGMPSGRGPTSSALYADYSGRGGMSACSTNRGRATACRTIRSRRSSRRGRSAGSRPSAGGRRSISRPIPSSMPFSKSASWSGSRRRRQGQRDLRARQRRIRRQSGRHATWRRR